MNFNPPLPFDRSSSETDYTGWFDMINSIVGFVTASTHLATTLRNSRCCFPENVSITEVTEECRSANDLEQFYLTDFPCFLEELEKTSVVSHIKCKVAQQYGVCKVIPLVQYPMYDVMHGEPNHEPRTFTLVDTQDFGDVNFRPAPCSAPTISRPIPSFNSVPSVETTKTVLKGNAEQASNDSCYFEEYTDSEQTIDSTNLQEYFERVEEQRQKANIRGTEESSNSEPLENNQGSSEKCQSTTVLEVSDEVEQFNTIYPGLDNRVGRTERTPEEPSDCAKIIKLPSRNEQIQETKHSEKAGDSRRLRKLDVYLDCTYEYTEPSSRRDSDDEENLSENNLSRANLEDISCVNSNPIKVLEDNSSATDDDKVVFKCAESTQIEFLGKSKSVSAMNDSNIDVESLISVYRRKVTCVKESKAMAISAPITDVDYLKRKKDSKKTLKTKVDFEVTPRKLQENQASTSSVTKTTSKRLSRDSIERKSSTSKTKSKNEKPPSKKDAQYSREVKMNSIMERETYNTDFITKNIVNCLEIKKKVKKAEKKPSSKNRPTSVFISPNERFPKSPFLSPQPINSGTNEPKIRKTSDRKSCSVDEVKQREAIKIPVPKRSQKKDSAKKTITRTVSNKEKQSSSDRDMTCAIPRPILKLPETVREMRSCLRTGTPRVTGRPKNCIFQEEFETPIRRPVTYSVPSRNNGTDRILPRMPLVRDTTLKLTAAQTIKKASELLKDVEEKFLRPTTEMKRRVVSGTIRPVTVSFKKK